MKLVHRRWLFYVSAIIFIVVGIYLTLLAQGLAFDFSKFRIVKTGGIFLDFKPTNNVNLLVNGDKRKTQTSFLSQGTLIKNLLPGTYRVLLYGDGLQNWEKNLSVESGRVTPRTSIRLFPINASSTELARDVYDFWQVGGGAAIESASGTVVYKNNRFKNTDIKSVNGANAIAKNGSSYILINFENTSSTINISNLFSTLKKQFSTPITTGIADVVFHPFSPNKLLISTKSALYVLDTKRRSLERLFVSSSTPIAEFKTDNSEVLINLKNRFVSINLVFQTTNVYDIPSGNIQSFKPSSDGNRVLFTNSDGYLFLYDKNTKLTRALGAKPNEFVFSPEEKRVVEIMKDKIQILYLDDWDGDIRKKPFEKTVIQFTDSGKTYSSFAWLDNNHFLIIGGNELIVNEIDDITPINSVKIADNIKKFAVKDSNTIFTLTSSGEFKEIDISEK